MVRALPLTFKNGPERSPVLEVISGPKAELVELAFARSSKGDLCRLDTRPVRLEGGAEATLDVLLIRRKPPVAARRRRPREA